MNTASQAPVDLAQLRKECEEMIRTGGGKIGAIKHAKMITGWDLIRAKNWVESFAPDLSRPRGWVTLPRTSSNWFFPHDCIKGIVEEVGDNCAVYVHGEWRAVSASAETVLALIAKAQS